MIRSSFVSGTRNGQVVRGATQESTDSGLTPRRRGALLAGTALAVVLGASTLMPQEAVAQCVTVVGPPSTFDCSGPVAGSQTIPVPPNTSPWTATGSSTLNLSGTGGLPALTIDAGGTEFGTANLNAGGQIIGGDGAGSHGLVIQDLGNGSSELNVNGAILGDLDSNSDGLRIIGDTGGDLTINVGPNDNATSGRIEGGDDGIVVVDDFAGDLVINNNGGTIVGHGLAGGGNDGEGILVAADGTNSPIPGSVTINNSEGGLIQSNGTPTSATGGQAIHVSANGPVSITNDATSNINGASDGVYVSGGDTVTVINHGHLEGRGDHGIEIESLGFTRVVNTGEDTILADEDGVHVTSEDSVEVINSGSIGSSIDPVGDDGIRVESEETITVSDDGTAYSGDVGGSIFAADDGIQAFAGNNVNIDVRNSSIESGDNGIVAIGGLGGGGNQDVVVHSGTIDAGGSGVIAASLGGDATVESHGETRATGLVGLGAASLGGDAEVTVGGKISDSGPLLFGAAALSIGGSATVIVDAEIDPPLIGAAAITILGDTAQVDVNAPIAADLAGAVALNLFGTNHAIVNVNEGGSIDSDGFGVVAAKIGGLAGDAIVTVNGDISATAFDGVLAVNANGLGGDVIVAGSADGSVAGTGNIDAGGNGITVLHFTPIGDAIVNHAGTITAGVDGINVIQIGNDGGNVDVTAGEITAGDDGIVVVKAFGDGNVSVTAEGPITATNDDGIFVDHVFGDGNTTIVTNGAIDTTSGDDGIEVNRVGGTGNVSVTANAAINAGDDGINVSKTLGSGDVSVMTGVDGDIVAGGTFGISAFNFAGNTTINAEGDVTASGLGVFGGSVLGNVDVTVGNVTATDNFFSSGMVGFSALGTSNVTVNGKIDANLVGAASVSLFNDATLTVNAGAHIDPLIGTVVVAGGNGVLANGGIIDGDLVAAVGLTGGTFTVNNTGTLQNVGGGAPNPEGLAIFSITGDGTIVNNDGTITGTVAFLGAEDDTFNNNAGGIWNTGGSGLTVNLFGFGNDVMNNAGIVFTGGDPAASPLTPNIVWMLGLNSWNNNGGILDMRDGTTNDVTWLTGVFASDSTWSGTGDSRLGVDAFLSYRGDPASPGIVQADVLAIGNPFGPSDGVTNGVTGLVVQDTNGGPGAFDPVGLPVVFVDDGILNGSTALGHFNIHPDSDNYDSAHGGVIDKGAFIYYVDMRPQLADDFPIGLPNPDNNAVHVLRSAPDADLFQIPGLITGAQNVWWDTTGVWHQRTADLRHYLLNRPLIQPAPVVKGDIKDRVVLKAPPVPAPVHVTPGLWITASGNWSERDRNSSFSNGGQTFQYDTGFEQKTLAIMGGADFGREGVFGPNDVLMFGALVGYISSDLDFNQEGTSAKYSGATVGGYATYLNDRWFVDAIVKADLLDMKYGASWASQKVDSTSIGAQVEVGYRQPWTQTMFFEPLASIGFVRTEIDDMTLAGLPVSLKDDTSIRGSLGLRVGSGGLTANGLAYEASVIGRVWNEFGANNSATVGSGNPMAVLPTFTDDFGGVFGQVGVKLDLFNIATNWSAFVTGDYRFNSDYQSVTGKIGARTRW